MRRLAPFTLALALLAPAPRPAEAGTRAAARAMQRAGLTYKHALTIGDTRYRLTDLFDMGDGRLATLAEVDHGGARDVRVFYRSKSQGVFRLLPAVNLAQRSYRGAFSGMPLLDKGDGEEHLTAPLPLQDLLGRLSAGRHRHLDFDDVVVPQVARYRSPRGYGVYLRSAARPTSGKLRLYDVVDGEPVIRRGLEPDYAHPLEAGRTRTQLDGTVERLRFPSKDGRLVYTLHVDAGGHAQIATVTVKDARVNRFGLPARTVTVGDVAMPRWEYPFQIPAGAVGAPHPKDDTYASSWAYLRTRPEIRAFYAATGRPMPAE